MKIFDVPLKVSDEFIEKWKKPKLSEKRAKEGMFIDIKQTENGVSILSIGNNPEFALVMFGIAYGQDRCALKH